MAFTLCGLFFAFWCLFAWMCCWLVTLSLLVLDMPVVFVWFVICCLLIFDYIVGDCASCLGLVWFCCVVAVCLLVNVAFIGIV